MSAECKHGAYVAKGGHLVCVQCGAPSPKADLDANGNLVKKIAIITCPFCGGKLTAEGKAIEKPEDKSIKLHEDKGLKRR